MYVRLYESPETAGLLTSQYQEKLRIGQGQDLYYLKIEYVTTSKIWAKPEKKYYY